MAVSVTRAQFYLRAYEENKSQIECDYMYDKICYEITKLTTVEELEEWLDVFCDHDEITKFIKIMIKTVEI